MPGDTCVYLLKVESFLMIFATIRKGNDIKLYIILNSPTINTIIKGK
jgi:hypothetical protein